MKKSLFTFGCALIVGLITSLSFVNASQTKGVNRISHKEKQNYVEGELIIKFKKSRQDVSSAEGVYFTSSFSDALHLTKKEILSKTNSMVFKTNLYDLETLIDVFNNADYIEYAQKNYIYHTTSLTNDTYISNLWGLHNTGQEYDTGTSGVVDADIDAAEGWNILTSASDIVVAVVDTGANLAHADLDGNLWTNSGETADGTDSDSNGYIDDVYGWNFVGSGATVDGGVHGTHVAGIIGAEGGNSAGVTGVAQDVQLMILQAGDAETEELTTADIIEAFQYASTNGADIVNASFANDTFDQSVKDAIDAMPGVLVVAAASNESVDNDTTPMYPASYTSSNIVSVAATNSSDNIASFSNYGATSVDVAAPGKKIYSTYADGTDYQWLSGTSQSAPIVTGMAALALAKDPTLTPSEIRTALINTSDAKAALNGKCVANGRVNLYNLLNSLETTPNTFPTQVTNLVATAGDTEIALTWTGSSDSDGTVAGYDVVYGTGSNIYTTLIQAGTSTSYTITGLTNGTTYYVGVKALDNDGANSTSYSTEASAAPAATANVTPATVTNLAATAGDTEVSLTWDTGSDSDGTISGYYVSHGTSSEDYGTQSTLITGTSTTITGLTNGTPYYFAVKAVDNEAATSTNFSNEVSVTPVGATNQVPTQVTGVAASAGNTQIALTWTASTDTDGSIAGYNIYYGTTSGTYTITVESGTTTSYTITELTNGTTYYVAVKAVDDDAALSASYSTEISATPTASFSANNAFTVTDFLPASDQDIVSVTPTISGKIGGSFSLVDAEIGATVSGTIDGSNQGFTGFGTDSGYSINATSRVFSIDLVELIQDTTSTFSAFDTGNQLTITVKLRDSELTTVSQTGSYAFTPNTLISNESDFTGSGASVDSNVILPISSEAFTFVDTVTLTPETPVSGVSEGLQVIIPAGTETSKTSTEFNTWSGEFEMPDVLTLPSSDLFPAGSIPLKRISVGFEKIGLTFDQSVTVKVPISIFGTLDVYTSQDGAAWTLDTTCNSPTAASHSGICTFTTTHFTQFTIVASSGGSYETYRGMGGGQNHMRYGGYTPNDVNSNFHGGAYINGVKTTYLNPHRNISEIIPHCEIPEELSILRRFYKLIGTFSGQYTECK